MWSEVALIGISAVVVSALLTGIVRKLALAHGLLDVPNARSSHSAVTPRGGGVSMALVTTAASVVLALLGTLQLNLLVTLVGGGTAVAVIGFLDDRHAASAGIRLAVHFAAAFWALIWIGGLPSLLFDDQILHLGWAGDVLAVLGIVWTLNLFNFMDGIDGIAASEGAFVAGGGALLTLLVGSSAGISAVGLVLGGTCVGFLLWNWPPAKIFMGDVGSGYLGFVIGVLALAATRDNPSALWTWVILGAVFFVDATVTLVRRLLRGERIYEAHRSHAYQWLARRWGSHKRVTTAVLVLNVVWLFPCALFATLYPNRAMWISAVALVPVIVMAIASGAGRREIRVS